MLIKELYQLYYERHALVRLRTPRNIHYFWTANGHLIGDKDAEQFTTNDAEEFFATVAQRSKSSAVRALNTLAAIFAWGVKRKFVLQGNPCREVPRLKIRARERFMLPDEITRFKKALAKESPDMQDMIWLMLFTGARKMNVMSMEWLELDMTIQLWRIPPEKYKTGESHLIALTDSSMAILERRRSKTGYSRFVFPGKGKSGHRVDIKRSWERVLRRARIEDFRVHDLRRTFGSYLAINGESAYIIGKALGHVDPRSTAVYARLNMDPVRSAMERSETTFLKP